MPITFSPTFSTNSKVARAARYAQNVADESIVLADESRVLWSQGEAYPPPGSDILKLPFRFTLPSHDILPTCQFDNKLDLSAKVTYWVEVIGVRGAFRLNTRIPRPFPVLPPHATGAELSQVLRAGWNGPWRDIVETKQVRKGIWGAHATATVTVSVTSVGSPQYDIYPQ